MKSENSPPTDCFKYGKNLLNLEFGIENDIEALTEKLIDEGKLGLRIPQIYEELGTALSLCLQIASCQWGCRGGQHREENLIRRLSNYAFAAIRLARLGLYDEAISMLRCIAELANLIELFTAKRELLDRWYTATPRERIKDFGPANVRKQIEETRNRPIVDKAAYAALCELGIHITPDSAHLSHDFEGKVFAGGSFSVPAFALVINELAIILSACLKISAYFVQPSEDKKHLLMDAGERLEGLATSWLRATNYQERLYEEAQQYGPESA